ncbi:MAG: hypothetical protein RL701_3862 [Pseudomonadota bacterium]|jgi:hypothetical protein
MDIAAPASVLAGFEVPNLSQKCGKSVRGLIRRMRN